jgi:type I restriction enzyme S subunit
VKAGWEQKRLGDVCTVNKRKHDGSSKPYVGMEDIESGTGRHLGAKSPLAVKSLTFAFTPDHVLYGRLRPYLNKVFLPDFDGHCSTEIFPLQPMPALDKGFLYHWITQETVVAAIDVTCTGARMPRADVNDILEFEIPLPHLDEQRRIVAVLDKAFAGIATATANAQKNLTNARAFFEGYLNSSFAECATGGELHKLSDLMEISHGFAFKGEDFSKSEDESKSIVLTPGNYTENAELDFSPGRTKRLATVPPRAFQFNEGDLTIVMTDLSSKMKILGKPAFIDRPNVLHNQRIGRVIFKTHNVHARLVYYFLRSDESLRRIRETATGTMVRHTAPSRILSNAIPVPKSANDQSAMVERLDGVDEYASNLEVLYRRKLTALTELKQSLLQKAFAGELT